MTTELATPKLARFFDKQREIIEAAETPFAKLAIFILPILSPIVPASLTGLHLYKLLLTIFTFQHADKVSFVLSIISALVLELLGYVGAISFIQSVFRLVRTKETLYVLPAMLNGIAYMFYLLLMFLINYQLGIYFLTPSIINNIVGILSFVTVPTGLLAANHLSQKEEKEEKAVLRKESREERLERLRIKHGTSETTSRSNMEVPKRNGTTSGSMGRPSIHQERVFSYLEEGYRSTGTVPTFTEVAKDLNIPDSTASRLRNKWLGK